MDSLKYFDYAYMAFALMIFVLGFEYTTPHGDRNPIVHSGLKLTDNVTTVIVTLIVFFFLLDDPQESYRKALKISGMNADFLVSLPLLLIGPFLHRYRRWLIAFVPAYYYFLTFYRNSTW